MKIYNKLLAIIITVAMIVGCVPFGVFAADASTTHKVTLSADKTTVKAGDSIVVEITLDTSLDICAMGYELAVPAGLKIDNSRNEDYYEENEVAIPAALDVDWYDYYDGLAKAAKWGDITFGGQNTAEFTSVIFGVAKDSGISASRAIENMVIGKYTVTVDDNAAAGTYDIYFETGDTTDGGKSFGANFDYAPLTITVEGEEEPTDPNMSKTHKVTLSADKTTVEPGDSIVVEITLDTSLDICAMGYELAVPAGLKIDNSRNEDYYEENEVTIPAALDVDWYDYYDGLAKAAKWGDITFGGQNTAEFTSVIFGVAKDSGISESRAIENMVIGRYTVTVDDNAAAGTYDIYFETGDTTDGGKSFGANFDYAPLTITVEGGAPVVNYYTVTYKVDGEVVETFTDVVEGSATPTFNYTAPEGYTFSGFGEIPATVTSDLTFEGTTTIKTFTVIYKVDGEVVDTFENVEYGATVPASTYVVPEGYTFTGFGEIPATVTDNLTFEGTTTVNSYKVTYKVDGEIVHEDTVEYGAAIPAYEYEVADGYTFSGWDATVPATMPAEDLVFEGTTEEIVIPQFKVTFMVGDLVVGTIYKNEGESVEKTEYPAVEPKEGHTIVWDNEGPITSEATVYGTYVANTYKVTYVVDGETVHEDTVEYGAAIPTYEYEVADGYTFSGWDATVPATMPATDLVFNGTTEEIPATMYKVTFVVDGEETTIEVEEGTAIGDQMPEDPTLGGYTFTGWTDDNGNDVDAETIVSGDMVVTANFEYDPHDVNKDGEINSKDSIFLLNYCALPEIYEIADEDLVYYDFNKDGKVTSKDAVLHFTIAVALADLYSIR